MSSAPLLPPLLLHLVAAGSGSSYFQTLFLCLFGFLLETSKSQTSLVLFAASPIYCEVTERKLALSMTNVYCCLLPDRTTFSLIQHISYLLIYPISLSQFTSNLYTGCTFVLQFPNIYVYSSTTTTEYLIIPNIFLGSCSHPLCPIS